MEGVVEEEGMITLKKLNGSEFTINAELIETVEASPDTVISLVTGNRYLVRENVQEVIQKVLEYRERVYSRRKAVNPIEGFERK